MIAWCRCHCLLLVPGCRVSVVGELVVDCLVSLSLFVVSSWLSGVGCQLLVVDCLVSLSLVAVSSWLSMSVVGCWLLIVWCGCRWLLLVPGCRMSVVGCWLLIACLVSLSLFVFSSWKSVVGCRVFVVDYLCRLSHTFSIVGAQLCL